MLNLHLDHLRYFREVARSSSLREAARRLHRSQPALSQALAEMERRLNVQLFAREGRRLRLTPQGQECLAFAQKLLAESEHFESRLQAVRSGTAGRLRVGMVDAALLYALPRTLKSFADSHPDVELRFQVATSRVLLERLLNYELDLAVMVRPAQLPPLVVIPVLREGLDVVKPRNDRGTLKEARWASYPATSHTRQLVDVALARLGATPDVALESEHPQVLAQVVAMGYGWSVLPANVWRPLASRVQRHGQAPIAYRELVATCRTEGYDVPAVRALLERIEATRRTPESR